MFIYTVSRRAQPITATSNASAIILSFCSTSSGIVKQLSYGQNVHSDDWQEVLIRWWSILQQQSGILRATSEEGRCCTLPQSVSYHTLTLPGWWPRDVSQYLSWDPGRHGGAMDTGGWPWSGQAAFIMKPKAGVAGVEFASWKLVLLVFQRR